MTPTTATWDVFIGDRLEVARGLDAQAIRAALARGEFRDDDLIRPAGSSDPWTRLGDLPDLAEPIEPVAEPEPAVAEVEPAVAPEPEIPDFAEDFEDVDDEEGSSFELAPAVFAPPPDDEIETFEGEPDDPLDEDNEAAEFTLTRETTETVEELDLAAMVDVAFQLVLFFLVTATTILYKTLEVPKPDPERPAGAVAQGAGRTLDDLRRDYILVEIDPAGAVRVDREPVAAEPARLIERLRQARESTDRKTMLLSADYATPHRFAVLAYDAANEIGLGIAIARPPAPNKPNPAPRPARKAAPS